MRFEVPQFIEIEDKIFGPLTWKQFLYLGGGVGMAVVIFLTLPIWIFIIAGIPLALLASALSFYPINNRPFSYFLESVYSYLIGQKLYLWRQQADVVHKEYATKEPVGAMMTVSTKPKTSIASLSRRLELKAIQKQQ